MEDLSKADRDTEKLYPDLRPRLARLMESMRTHYKPIFLVEGFRSMERQKYLYEKKIKVTNALPGSSFHNFGLAVDLAFLDARPYADYHEWFHLRRLAIANGFEPISKFDNRGALTGDLPHFNCRYGFTIPELKELYAIQGIESIWYAIDKKRGVEPGLGWLPSPFSAKME